MYGLYGFRGRAVNMPTKEQIAKTAFEMHCAWEQEKNWPDWKGNPVHVVDPGPEFFWFGAEKLLTARMNGRLGFE
jgi:hypothetical protein